MRHLFYLLVIAVMMFSSCTTEKIVIQETVIHDTVYVNEFNRDYMLLAILWYQTSGEMRALSYQAFNLSRMRLDEILKAPRTGKPLAIVVDIDETMVDNSQYEAQNVLGNFGYPEKWGDWISSASAKAMPGAVEFINYAASKGVEIFYISNRKTNEKEATIINMKALGFPMVDDAHLLLREKSSGKESRRQKVLETHQIVLLIGDNLNDFSEAFENKDVDARFAVTDSLRNEFGSRFIMLPNPMYGDWESAVFEYNFKRSETEKDSIRKSSLMGF